MRVGVTGASGFIGSHLFAALKKRGDSIISLQRRNQTGPFDAPALKQFVQGKDVIYHLAGVNRASGQDIISGNLACTLHLVQAIRETKKPARLVFASSAQVYSPVSRNPIKEDRRGNPATLYGVTKKAAEDLICLHGLDYVILRFANIYGPGCRSYHNSVIATLCDRAVRGQPLVLNGDGKQGRDFVYIDDAVSALLAVDEGPSGIFNVSSGTIISLRRIVNAIKHQIPKVPVEYCQDADTGGPSYCCDPTRFMKKYPWKPETSLRKGIRETLDWAKAGFRNERY